MKIQVTDRASLGLYTKLHVRDKYRTACRMYRPNQHWGIIGLLHYRYKVTADLVNTIVCVMIVFHMLTELIDLFSEL